MACQILLLHCFDDNSSLECSNSFSSLSSLQDTSFTFSPTITSSPKNPKSSKPRSQNRRKNNYNSKRQNRKLKAVVINFQGLRTKVESLAALINTSSPDIIFGTETWANNTITNAELFPSHFDVYDIWRKDRPDSHLDDLDDGVVLLAVKKDLLATPLPHLDADCEIVWAKMKVAGSRDVYLGSFYNPRYNDAKGLPQSFNEPPPSLMGIRSWQVILIFLMLTGNHHLLNQYQSVWRKWGPMYISSQHCYNSQPATTSQFLNKTAEHFGSFLYDQPNPGW